MAESEMSLAEIVSDAVRLLREFPNHIQAGEWRREIAKCRAELPAVAAEAERLAALDVW